MPTTSSQPKDFPGTASGENDLLAVNQSQASRKHVFWIFGLSGAGKSTLALGLAAGLSRLGRPVLKLDGDALRDGLCRGLGFSDADRTENLRRAAEVARLSLESSISVVASFITPRQAQRDLVREIVGSDNLSLIWADAPLQVCQERDVKGLYAKAQAGKVHQMTGVTSHFDPPTKTDLIVPTAVNSEAESIAALQKFAQARLGIDVRSCP